MLLYNLASRSSSLIVHGAVQFIRSCEYWNEIASTEDAMTAGEVSNHPETGSSNCAASSNSVRANWRGGVYLFRMKRVDYVFRAADKDAASWVGEAQRHHCAASVSNSVPDQTVDGGWFTRGPMNDQSSLQFPQRGFRNIFTSSSWSGRQIRGPVWSFSYLFRSESPQILDGWRPLKADHVGSRSKTQRKDPLSYLNSKKPAARGDGLLLDLILAPELTSYIFLFVKKFHKDKYDPTGGALPFCNVVIKTSRVHGNVPHYGLADCIGNFPVTGWYDLLQTGGGVNMQGCETENENPKHYPHALRSLHQWPEHLNHKRAKFLSVPTLHPSESACSGGSHPSSSSLPASSSGVDHGNQLLSSVPLSLTSKVGNQRSMDLENVGGEDSDDGDRKITLADLDGCEIRMDLTDDLLHKVFSFLDDNALCKAAIVCKQWKTASAHEDFWKILNFEGRHVSHNQVGLLCARYPKATTLNLRGAACVDEILVREAMRSLRNLEVLSIGRGVWSDGFFYALSMECSSLQNLSISDATLGSGGAHEIQLCHESLRRLQINKCRVLRIAIRCPQLDWLSLKRTGTASAVLHCPQLNFLDVSSCHKLSDAGVRAAVTACPLLACLDISNCTYVSDETLREISVACTSLRVLDASYCPNISLEGVRLPMLIELKLQGCEGIISSSMAALATCAFLEDLSMDFCWLLTAVSLDLPRLRQISLTNNRKFVELTLRSPVLLKLNLVNCPVLSRVDITSNSLQSLVLRQQSGLSSMALQCSWLVEVDLSECEALTDGVCEVFSDDGGCPKLRSLILDNCEGLNHVKLASASIQSLSLTGCRNISSLILSCPFLQQLHLDGCDHLMEASFTPVGLRCLNLGICPHLVELTVEGPQMTTLDLRGCGVLSRAAIHCPSLMSLDASYCSHLGDDCLDETTSACPSIQSLVLASCPSVGPVGLLTLKRLRNLTTLDLSYTFLTDLSPIFEACPGLKVLRLSACKYLGSTALDALHGGKVLPELLELDLSYGSLRNSALERVLALCPHLCHVSLNGCAHVTDFLWARLSSPPRVVLQTAEVSSIENFGVGDAEMINVQNDNQELSVVNPMDVASASLDSHILGPTSFSENGSVYYEDGKLNLAMDLTTNVKGSNHVSYVGSAILSDMPFEASRSEIPLDAEIGSVRALQNLSCVGCPHIKKVVIPRFAACLHLSSLNLSLSVNIEEVQLSCSNLTSLNLSNCAGLVLLELNCPRLMSLFLQACGIEADVLELAIQGCDLLETLDVRGCSKVSSAALVRVRLLCPGLKRLYSSIPP